MTKETIGMKALHWAFNHVVPWFLLVMLTLLAGGFVVLAILLARKFLS